MLVKSAMEWWFHPFSRRAARRRQGVRIASGADHDKNVGPSGLDVRQIDFERVSCSASQVTDVTRDANDFAVYFKGGFARSSDNQSATDGVFSGEELVRQ
jgi:hypothetical protein